MAIENNNYGWQIMHSALGDAYTVLYKALMYDCKIPHSELERITSVLETALRVKERNCDVGTPEEQAERYGRYCDKFTGDGMHCETCPCCGKIPFGKCEFAWAQTPYAAEEGVGK